MRPVYLLFLALGLQAAAGQTPAATPAADVDALMRAGVAAEQHGDNQSAIDDFRKVLALRPDMLQAHAGLGSALAAVGQYDAAIEEDEHVLAAIPNRVEVRQSLALAYYKKGDLGRAREQAEMVHNARPLDVSAAVLLGYIYIKMGRNGEAADLLSPLEPGHENDMQLEYVLGFGLIESGKVAEGLPRMDKVAHATHSADAYFIAGSAHFYRREFRDASDDADAAIQVDPKLPGLYTLAGEARYALGETDLAISAFETALRQDPRDFAANLYLGIVRLKQRDFETARPLLELAVDLQPAVPLARLELAKLNSVTGKYAEAVKTLEDLEKSNPNWLDPHVELATLYYKLHRPEDGQREREIVEQIEAKQQKAGPSNQ